MTRLTGDWTEGVSNSASASEAAVSCEKLVLSARMFKVLAPLLQGAVSKTSSQPNELRVVEELVLDGDSC